MPHKSKQRKPGKRTRKHSVTVYFSGVERAELNALAAASGKTVSALIRKMVQKAVARKLPASRTKVSAAVDPRQLRFA